MERRLYVPVLVLANDLTTIEAKLPEGVVAGVGLAFSRIGLPSERMGLQFHADMDPVSGHYDLSEQPELDADIRRVLVSATVMAGTPIGAASRCDLGLAWGRMTIELEGAGAQLVVSPYSECVIAEPPAPAAT